LSGNLRRLGFTGENLPDWHPEGSCNGRTDLDWYGETPDEIAAVKAVCGVCPVAVTCLQNALDRREAWGIWGGLDEKERAEYAKKLGTEAPTIARHGERARYVGTKSTPGCRCDLCRRAHATYEHERRLIVADRKRAGWTPPTKPCVHCRQQFTPKNDRHVYCSSACNGAVQKERQRAARTSRRCTVCRRSIPAGKKRYCSQECAKRGGQRLALDRRMRQRGLRWAEANVEVLAQMDAPDRTELLAEFGVAS
jgi:predicted nucleic acid-binding Zn ribbon protein